MRFHREGRAIITGVLLLVIAGITAVHILVPDVPAAHYISYATGAFLLIAVLQFFRNPRRLTPAGDRLVIAPADGKIVVIEEVAEAEYLKDRRRQISIFMSPVNVHVNRNPVSGKVKYIKYHPGKYLVAFHPKSSVENERTTLVIEHASGVPVLFRQIAGAVARRIRWYLKEGETVNAGSEMGFIKFGSRVDILLPLDVKIKVRLGQVIRGGETVIAELP